MSRTGTVAMHGNTYEVDPGLAVPLRIKRHVHPRAQPPSERAEPTGIDYLGLIRERRERELERRIDYRRLPGPPGGGADHGHDHGKESIG